MSDKMIEQVPKTETFRNALTLMKVFHFEMLCAVFGIAHH